MLENMETGEIFSRKRKEKRRTKETSKETRYRKRKRLRMDSPFPFAKECMRMMSFFNNVENIANTERSALDTMFARASRRRPRGHVFSLRERCLEAG